MCVSDVFLLVPSTLQMLAAIEGKMEELFEELENLPAEKVEAAEKVCPSGVTKQ